MVLILCSKVSFLDRFWGIHPTESPFDTWNFSSVDVCEVRTLVPHPYSQVVFHNTWILQNWVSSELFLAETHFRKLLHTGSYNIIWAKLAPEFLLQTLVLGQKDLLWAEAQFSLTKGPIIVIHIIMVHNMVSSRACVITNQEFKFWNTLIEHLLQMRSLFC